MSLRRAQIVLLCEDAQHEAFGRRLLEEYGWKRQQIRVERYPKGKACGEQWVRERYPLEVNGLRRSHVARVLLVVIDADVFTSHIRNEQLEESLRNASVDARKNNEPIGIFVPQRNIETWIRHLRDEPTDEETAYPHLARERECRDAVKELKKRCDQNKMPPGTPPSLQAACVEWRSRVLSLSK